MGEGIDWEAAEQLADRWMRQMELRPIACPSCSIQFGMTGDDMRFAEQTDEPVHCPRGHKMRLYSKAPS